MKDRHIKISAIVLAAGLSSRMGNGQKLILPFRGKPLICHMLKALTDAPLVGEVVVVTGHEREAVQAAALGQDVSFVHNVAYSDGLSGSIKAGVDAIGGSSDGILICHGDMPQINEHHIQALCAAFLGQSEKIIVPVFQGKQGNPVLWPKSNFSQLKSLKGDRGAKAILQANADAVVRVDFDDAAIVFDVDDPATLAKG